MEKKKILIVMGGSYMGMGGIESMIMNYYRAMDKRILQIDFVFFGNGQGLYDEELLKNGSELFHLPIKSKHYIKSKKEMYALLMREKYDVVHANLNAAGILEALKIAKKCGVTVRIAHAHSTNHGTKNKIRWLINDNARKRITAYSTHNFACSDLAGEWYFGKQNYTIVPNAITVDKFLFSEVKRSEVRKKFGVTNKFVIGHVGNLGYPKNQEFLLNVFAKLVKKECNAELWLVGEGEDLDALCQIAENLGIRCAVRFLGKRDDVHDLMQAMDVFVLPSFFEGFPVVIVEAVASDLFCVISNSITKMAQLSEKVKMLDLQENMDNWVDEILNAKLKERGNNLEVVTQKGFNINVEAKKLQHFYCYGRYE